MSRPIEHEYTDPLDLVWIHAARCAGIEVVRDPEVNASWDGRGTLRIGTPETLDADDCLAQMILHEMCHALVAGDGGFERSDWGLEYGNDADQVFEKAALRLQAAFADRFGLRKFFAATTMHREYYDAIGNEPLASDDPAASRARTAMNYAAKIRWLAIIDDALRATRAIADLVAGLAGSQSLWSRTVVLRCDEGHQRDEGHESDGSDESNGNHGSGENATTSLAHNSHSSHSSHAPPPAPEPPALPPAPKPKPPTPRLLPLRGDYQTLLSFQKAEVVYDITFRFAHKFLSRGDRTIDQMIQSARSGKQNILEGSKAGTTSKETEIKLTNVGRASLEELLADYRDFLRVRDFAVWEKNSPEALFVRELGRRTPQVYEIYREIVESRPAEIIANMAICLIHQTNYLLDQQLKTLEREFVENGGLRERMTHARKNHLNQRDAN